LRSISDFLQNYRKKCCLRGKCKKEKILSGECLPWFIFDFLSSGFEAKFGFQGRMRFYFIVTVTAWIHDILKFFKSENVLGTFSDIILETS